ncbi:hypothetical protein CYMTET_29650 [Cymbomonas tetramitiformis]|uniref:Uncharacterized protein n=1 Tax=Cymbomonas tetramitiformis TaxID=36881 RepID=A0AAE0FKC1_9CHLO|nr:hypothetical protein CYMTET_29650 [Cymbomonas tetramitiformis]
MAVGGCTCPRPRTRPVVATVGERAGEAKVAVDWAERWWRGEGGGVRAAEVRVAEVSGEWRWRVRRRRCAGGVAEVLAAAEVACGGAGGKATTKGEGGELGLGGGLGDGGGGDGFGGGGLGGGLDGVGGEGGGGEGGGLGGGLKGDGGGGDGGEGGGGDGGVYKPAKPNAPIEKQRHSHAPARGRALPDALRK